MIDWYVLLTPLIVLPIVLLFAFVGCKFEVRGLPASVGQSGDIPVPGPYGFALTHAAFFRPSDNSWHIFKGDIFAYFQDPSSTDSTEITFTFGQSGDIPIPGNFDPQEYSFLPAFFRPSDSTYHIGLTRPDGTVEEIAVIPFKSNAFTFQGGDIPFPPAHYFGNEYARQVAIYRPSTAQWFIFNIKSVLGPTQYEAEPLPPFTIQISKSGDIPVPGDYEGNGITQPAVFQPSTGSWLVGDLSGNLTRKIPSSLAVLSEDFMLPPENYQGRRPPFISKKVFAVFRPSTSYWYLLDLAGNISNSFPVGTPGPAPAIPAPGNYNYPGENVVQAVVFSGGYWSKFKDIVHGGS